MLTRKSDYIRANGEGRLDTGVARMRKTTMAQYSARTPIRDLDLPMPSRILRQALRRSKVHVVAARIRHGLPRASHPRQNSSGTDPGPRAPHLRSPAVTVRPTGQHMTALSDNDDYVGESLHDWLVACTMQRTYDRFPEAWRTSSNRSSERYPIRPANLPYANLHPCLDLSTPAISRYAGVPEGEPRRYRMRRPR